VLLVLVVATGVTPKVSRRGKVPCQLPWRQQRRRTSYVAVVSTKSDSVRRQRRLFGGKRRLRLSVIVWWRNSVVPGRKNTCSDSLACLRIVAVASMRFYRRRGRAVGA
jgi:hypothetical protein